MFDPNPDLDRLLQRLLHPALKVIDPGLERVGQLLDALGNPHHRLPPVVHVAGTNGKGSVIAYLRAVMEASGYRVHAYTSPHLVHFRERIMLAGKPIGDAYLVQLIEQIYALQERHPATFFEATTAAAFLAFAETSADIVLLETGMGGRLDATNMLDAPAATVIMPIGMDHAEFLGGTVAKIAAEKAAIMKPGVPSIIAPQPAEAVTVIAAHAQKIGAKLLRAGQQWNFSEAAGNTWNYQGVDERMPDLPMPNLIGVHQLPNAATAVAVLEQLQSHYPAISHETIAAGLKGAKWPARLQQLEDGYWRKQLPEGVALYLDGGHNPMAAERLAEWARAQGKPVYLVLGMLNTKDAKGFLRPWQGIAQAVHCVTIPNEPSSQDALTLHNAAQSCGIDAVAEESIELALQHIAGNESGIVLICGSLYLAGYVLSRQEMPSD